MLLVLRFQSSVESRAKIQVFAYGLGAMSYTLHMKMYDSNRQHSELAKDVWYQSLAFHERLSLLYLIFLTSISRG